MRAGDGNSGDDQGLKMGRVLPIDERFFPAAVLIQARKVRSLAWVYEQIVLKYDRSDSAVAGQLPELAATIMEAIDQMMDDLEEGVAALEPERSEACRRTGT